MRRAPAIVLAALGVVVASTGCSVPAPQAAPVTASATASPSTTPTAVRPSATPSATPSPTATPTRTASSDPSPPRDTRKGSALRRPYQVDGVPVVSKKHRITAAYRPPRPTGPYGLDAPVAAALGKMTAAAAKAGVRIRVRSGYRNWATQNAIYRRALRNYPQSISFYAPAGASEHQTGLAVDLWDGVTWSLPMARTSAGKWLFRHARQYGFVLRYPDGKSKITGYHYEPWHYRWIGTKHSLKFPNNRLTLEEYLGLA